jgi:hypothetical protein
MVDHLKFWSVAGVTDPCFESEMAFFWTLWLQANKISGLGLIYHSTEGSVSCGLCDVMRDLFCAGMCENRWLVYQGSIPGTGKDLFLPQHPN